MLEDDNSRVKLLYELAKGSYQPSSSWVSVKKFVPMFDKAPKEEFIPAPLLNDRYKFVPTEIKNLGTGTGTRTLDQ